MALMRGLSADLLEKGGMLGHRRSNSGGRLLESGEYLAAAHQEGQRDGRSTPRSCSKGHHQPHGRSRLSQSSGGTAVAKDETLRRTVALVALSVLATTVVILLGLLTLAAAGRSQPPLLRGDAPASVAAQQPTSKIAHILAEGLASMASRLDPDAVEEFAPPRGYIRKALVESRDRLSAREQDAMRLQAFYDAEIMRLSQEFDKEREAFQHKVEEQQVVLKEIFGEDAVSEQFDVSRAADL